MSESPPPNQVEFIQLNGVTLRVTSWRAGAEPGTFDLVTITRGSRDAETLDDLFREPRLALDTGDRNVRSVRVAAVDRRTVGEGQAAIIRYGVTFTDAASVDDPPAPPAPTVDERLAALETEVRELRILLVAHANGIRH